MKKIIFLLIFSISCLNLSAQWKRQYIPGDELRGYPSEWSYNYDTGDKAVVFTESGTLMIVTKDKKFAKDRNGNILVIIGIYINDKLYTKGQFSFVVTPDGHAAGGSKFQDYLKLVRNGATIRIIAPIKNDFDFDLATTRMYEGQRVIFNRQ